MTRPADTPPAPLTATARTFDRLSDEQLAKVDEMLLGGTSYENVLAYMAECGLTCSKTSVADYYYMHILPRKWEHQRWTLAESLLLDKSPI